MFVHEWCTINTDIYPLHVYVPINSKQLCMKYFGSATRSSAGSVVHSTVSMPSKGQRGSRLGRPQLLPGQMGRGASSRGEVTTGDNTNHHRQLRLRSSSSAQESAETFTFMPELVAERGRARMREFLYAYQALGPAMKVRMDSLDKQLRTFGYSLFQWQMTSQATTMFSKYELNDI